MDKEADMGEVIADTIILLDIMEILPPWLILLTMADFQDILDIQPEFIKELLVWAMAIQVGKTDHTIILVIFIHLKEVIMV